MKYKRFHMNLLSNNKNNGCILLLASIFAVYAGIMPIYGQNNKQKKDAGQTKMTMEEFKKEFFKDKFEELDRHELYCDTFLLSKIYRYMIDTTSFGIDYAVIDFIDIQPDRWYFSVTIIDGLDQSSVGYYSYPKCVFWIREPYPTQFVYGKSKKLKHFRYEYQVHIFDPWPDFFEYRPSTKSLQRAAPPIPENLPKNVYWCGTDGYVGDFYEYVEHSDSTIRMRTYNIDGSGYIEFVCKTEGLVITQDNWDKNYEYEYISSYTSDDVWLKVIEKGKDSYTILPIIERKDYLLGETGTPQ